ncbi:Putative protein of unknown function [Podospora comata]|uniref:Lysine-specific metallo-endopeptidase domain-containing protein n=1 Tax=Podospora comata TaxID=48703 RepID=A0ABY6SEY4_PODCO|nr:Putative protein of unknown function [Podospora comata]
MARISFILSLTACLLTLLPLTVGVEIYDIFDVERNAANNGGCGARMATLDVWLSDSLESLDVALTAIDNYRQNVGVRRALSTFFGIRNTGGGATPRAVNDIRNNLAHVYEFLNHHQEDGNFFYDSTYNHLHCDSTFLVPRAPNSPAFDLNGQVIVDQNGNQVTIENIPSYHAALDKDARASPWWAGDFTNLNGYYFDEQGGNFCQGDHLGATAHIKPLLTDGATGTDPSRQHASVIICPHAFVGSTQPDNYRDANNLIAQGTNFALVVPKSATLLHEVFHVVGGDYYLSGPAETYPLLDALNLASRRSGLARQNPENYVFFVAHMYHMLGQPEGNEPWSIGGNWDFRVTGSGSNRLYAATAPPP